MTIRQRLLNLIYPLFVRFIGKSKPETNKILVNDKEPIVSFYSLQHPLIDGTMYNFDELKGKKVLLVNTASDCGYTGQYDDLQKIYETDENGLVILGFPANDFKEQEKGSGEEIAAFCRKNYGVQFPLMQKSHVVKSDDQNPVFEWLTEPAKNGWNSKAPSWNFCKYLVDEEGRLTHFFGPAVQPTGNEILQAIKN